MKSCVTSPPPLPPHLALTLPLASLSPHSSLLCCSSSIFRSVKIPSLPPSIAQKSHAFIAAFTPRVLVAAASFRPSHTSCGRLHTAKQTLLKKRRELLRWIKADMFLLPRLQLFLCLMKYYPDGGKIAPTDSGTRITSGLTRQQGYNYCPRSENVSVQMLYISYIRDIYVYYIIMLIYS